MWDGVNSCEIQKKLGDSLTIIKFWWWKLSSIGIDRLCSNRERA
jgi:hypothetical protein